MTRPTRNSQRAASEAIPVPPSASRPASPHDSDSHDAPFAAANNKATQDQQNPAPLHRRRMRPALTVITDATPLPMAINIADRDKSPSPSPAPFRRPPTGSKATRRVLGDLMTPPPPMEPDPSEAGSVEPNDENQENAVPTTRLVPVPFNPKNKPREPNGLEDPFWDSSRRPVHRAKAPRPDDWEKVGYYQEDCWDSDDEEYPQPSPRPPVPAKKSPMADRNIEWGTYRSSVDEPVAKSTFFKPSASPYIRSWLKFAPLTEGKKLRLLESNGKAKYWKGVKTPQEPNAAPTSPPAKVYELPNNEEVDVDENGDPLPNPDIHPLTGLPAAEWLAGNVEDLIHRAMGEQKKLESLHEKQAICWGKLQMENHELEEDEMEIFELLRRVKRIVPPKIFAELVSAIDGTDMDDPTNIFASPKKVTCKKPIVVAKREGDKNGDKDPEDEGESSDDDRNDESEDEDDDENSDRRPMRLKGIVDTNVLASVPQSTPRRPPPSRALATLRPTSARSTTEGNFTRRVPNDPSSPRPEENDEEDADDENESLARARKGTDRKRKQASTDATFDDFYSDEEATWKGPPAQVEAQNGGENEDEEAGGPHGEPTNAATLPTAAFKVYVDDVDTKQRGVEGKGAPKRSAPLGPKGSSWSVPKRNLKRDRDEEDSEDSDAENDENENVQVPSKKRRVSGYYGASDENTPIASASQAESDTSETHEDDESSGKRPLLPILRYASSEDEDENIPSVFAGDIEPARNASISVHLDGLDGDDTEMWDVSDEGQNNENAAPAPTAAALAPAPTLPLLPAPAVVSTTRALRARPLRREETLLMRGKIYRPWDGMPGDD